MIGINFAGAIGQFAADKDAAEVNEILVRELFPLFEQLAARVGWAAVLNALHTVVYNVGARELGIEQVRAAHQSALDSLPRLAALIAADHAEPGRA